METERLVIVPSHRNMKTLPATLSTVNLLFSLAVCPEIQLILCWPNKFPTDILAKFLSTKNLIREDKWSSN